MGNNTLLACFAKQRRLGMGEQGTFKMVKVEPLHIESAPLGMEFFGWVGSTNPPCQKTDPAMHRKFKWCVNQLSMWGASSSPWLLIKMNECCLSFPDDFCPGIAEIIKRRHWQSWRHLSLGRLQCTSTSYWATRRLAATQILKLKILANSWRVKLRYEIDCCRPWLTHRASMITGKA